jgi:hypothetical protein
MYINILVSNIKHAPYFDEASFLFFRLFLYLFNILLTTKKYTNSKFDLKFFVWGEYGAGRDFVPNRILSLTEFCA